jgi:nucleoside-diphosphate-sugar epimerase
MGDGRVWLITGASSGFGRAIAEAALARGDAVVATARRTDGLDDLAPGERVHVIVEPGAFRTGLFRPGAAYESAEMQEYADTGGPTREVRPQQRRRAAG